MKKVEEKLEDMIITSPEGVKFIFSAYPINKDNIESKITEYETKGFTCKEKGDLEGAEKALEMIELLKAGSYEGSQKEYLDKGLTHFPSRPYAEREEKKSELHSRRSR